ncbi:CISD1 [Cordylochernes scorpioides]|uniref:CISD1 n=1 Tax=Cordylochernes scorpioides TaxID=51811 RepID=A0ABY6L4Y9_9ARAC|nr:CISD1 [Cordylochernes scorpioides]
MLASSELIHALPWIGTAAAVAIAIYIKMKSKKESKDVCNPCIDKECQKIVHTKDIEELGDKTCFCRCWRSKKFPLCDGSHNAHNEATGDNVGPLIIKKKEK